MNTKKLSQIHEQIKNHPFRLDHSDWRGFYHLLNKLDKEFCNCLDKLFNKDVDVCWSGWGFFIHELRSAIWHFQFEFNDGKIKEDGYYERGRFSLKAELEPNERTEKEREEYKKRRYGQFVPEYQRKIVIVIENYIQQIHKFIDTEVFEEFITYYLGGDNCMEDIQSNGKSRWNKYKLNKDTKKFEFVGKLK